MNRIAQQYENQTVMSHFNRAIEEYKNIEVGKFNPKKLRSCNALVIETPNYFLLRSYSTFIACIEKSTAICYDALRAVYGFTHTSAQHIAKFRNDYPSVICRCVTTWTYRDI